MFHSRWPSACSPATWPATRPGRAPKSSLTTGTAATPSFTGESPHWGCRRTQRFGSAGSAQPSCTAALPDDLAHDAGVTHAPPPARSVPTIQRRPQSAHATLGGALPAPCAATAAGASGGGHGGSPAAMLAAAAAAARAALYTRPPQLAKTFPGERGMAPRALHPAATPRGFGERNLDTRDIDGAQVCGGPLATTGWGGGVWDRGRNSSVPAVAPHALQRACRGLPSRRDGLYVRPPAARALRAAVWVRAAGRGTSPPAPPLAPVPTPL